MAAPCIWFCGLSGAGKTTIARLLHKQLGELCPATMLDGDELRSGLCSDLGFSDADRSENLRRIREVAKIFHLAGIVPIVSCISPFEADRMLARELFSNNKFLLIFVDTPLDVCISRDPKGLYKKAIKGQLARFTGIDSPFEAPLQAEIHVCNQSPEEAVQAIMQTPVLCDWIRKVRAMNL